MITIRSGYIASCAMGTVAGDDCDLRARWRRRRRRRAMAARPDPVGRSESCRRRCAPRLLHPGAPAASGGHRGVAAAAGRSSSRCLLLVTTPDPQPQLLP